MGLIEIERSCNVKKPPMQNRELKRKSIEYYLITTFLYVSKTVHFLKNSSRPVSPASAYSRRSRDTSSSE